MANADLHEIGREPSGKAYFDFFGLFFVCVGVEVFALSAIVWVILLFYIIGQGISEDRKKRGTEDWQWLVDIFKYLPLR